MEYKFKGKRVDNGEWAYGDLIIARGKSAIKIGNEYQLEEEGFEDDFVEVLPETVGMFTGLTDKNGKEIFGGDILSKKYDKKSKNGGYIAGSCGHHPENAKIVSWENGEFELGETKNLYHELCFQRHFGGFELIGDKFSNPELLNERTQKRRTDEGLCKKCDRKMEKKSIENVSVADGDGCACYYDEKYYHCENCNQWYDDDFDECEEPIQQPLI